MTASQTKAARRRVKARNRGKTRVPFKEIGKDVQKPKGKKR